MSARPTPKLYRPKVSYLSRLKNRRYLFYTLRELAGLFVALYAFIFAYQISQLIYGANAYQRTAAYLQSPFFLAFDVVVLLFALLHAVTWIDLNTLVLPQIKFGKMRVGRSILLAGGIALWILVSGVIAMLLLRG